VAVDLGSMIARCFDEDCFPCSGTFRFEHADQLPLVRLDPVQGEHLLRTLFTVASQLSRSHGAVVIRTAAVRQEVEISVSCQITSMSETSSQTLMDPFNRNLNGSSGLALASVKRIAESHGGCAAVHAGENELTLRVSLPAA
jgi:signal transduction histidine kinase